MKEKIKVFSQSRNIISTLIVVYIEIYIQIAY